jgi:ATP-dependent DNA ligase
MRIPLPLHRMRKAVASNGQRPSYTRRAVSILRSVFPSDGSARHRPGRPFSGAAIGHAPAPMLARLELRLPISDRWRYEPKLDGFRGLLWRRSTRQVQLLSRNARDLGPWLRESSRARL